MDVLRECVVEGGGLYGYFGEQGLYCRLKMRANKSFVQGEKPLGVRVAKDFFR